VLFFAFQQAALAAILSTAKPHLFYQLAYN